PATFFLPNGRPCVSHCECAPVRDRKRRQTSLVAVRMRPRDMRPAGRQMRPTPCRLPVLRRCNGAYRLLESRSKNPNQSAGGPRIAKADGFSAIKRLSFFSCREIPSPPEQPTAAVTPPPVLALWFSSAQSTE